MKKKKNKRAKDEINEIYNQFDAIYKPETHKLSRLFLERISDRHYDYPTINKVVQALIWFENTYGSEKYKMSFGFNGVRTGDYCFGMKSRRAWITVYDHDNNSFAEYQFFKSSKEYVAELALNDSNVLIDDLKEDGLYNYQLHIIPEKENE